MGSPSMKDLLHRRYTIHGTDCNELNLPPNSQLFVVIKSIFFLRDFVFSSTG